MTSSSWSSLCDGAMRVLAGVVFCGAVVQPALADVPVFERGLLPGDGAVLPATNSQADLTIAKGADTYLVAWTDFRARSSGSQTIQSDADVFGIRVDGDGNPIDAAPFLIAGGMGYQQKPKVAWNGVNWLVMFESQDPTLPPVTSFQTRIRFTRVSPQGQTLNATPLSLPPTQFDPDTVGLTLSGVGGQWLIARCIYHNDGYGTYLAGQRISSAGQLLDAAPVMLNDWVYGPLQIIATNGEYLAIGPDWNNAPTLKARRIGANLQPLAASFNLPANAQSIAGNGAGEYYVTWIPDFVNVFGSRMTSTGSLLTPGGTLLVDNPYWGIKMTHDGANWWLVRSAADMAYTMRISPAGTRLDPVGGVQLPIVVTGTANALYDASLTPRLGGGVMFGWTDLRQANGYDQNGFVLPVSSTNTAGTEVCLTTGTRTQRSSEMAMGPGGTVAVAYVSEAANDDRVLVQILDAAGNATSAEPIEVAQAPTIGTCGIAWNGSTYMVTWDQGGAGLTTTSIVARRMQADGSLPEAAFSVMPGQAPSIESLNGNFCIAGTRFFTNPQFIDLWISRVDGETTALLDGPNGVMLSVGYYSGQTRTRTDGAQWIVTSHSMWSHDSSQGDAVLAMVPFSGAPAPVFNPTPFAGGTGDPDIAFSEVSSLVVWRMNSLGNANNYVAGRIMHTDGTYGPSFTIAEATGRQLRPTVTWDGTAFIVAWDDQRHQAQFYDARTDVYATRVSEAGTLLDAQPFIVTGVGGGSAECTPSLLSVGGVTYASSTRFMNTGGFDSYRVGFSVLGTIPCDSIDFNRDGLFPDTQDIDDFLAVFAGGACPTGNCGDIDFNNDTLFPDTTDIDALLSVFSGGPCQ